MMEHTLTSKNDTVIKFFIRNGVDYNTIYSNFAEDTYSLKDIELRPGDAVLDIGAYAGGTSLYAASRSNKIKVYACEALPENCELIKKNCDENGFDNVKIINCVMGGVTGIAGVAEPDYKSEHGFNANIVERTDPGARPVPHLSLKDIFTDNKIKHCRILKTNCEGAEFEFLKTCPLSILAKIDYIVGQHHNGTRKELLDLTGGLFEDVPCKNQTDSTLGGFFFRRKGL